jgi:hypothetical protein
MSTGATAAQGDAFRTDARTKAPAESLVTLSRYFARRHTSVAEPPPTAAVPTVYVNSSPLSV